MFAATLTTIASLEVVLPGENDVALIAVIVISFFQLWHFAKLRIAEGCFNTMTWIT